MSTIDKAAEVIRTWQYHYPSEMDLNPDWSAVDIAEKLYDAERLAPDLPEPDKGWPDPEESMWHLTDSRGVCGGHVWAYHKYQMVELALLEKFTELTPAQARDLADKLRAAANHAEQETTNA